jgi:hypothetical protein
MYNLIQTYGKGCQKWNKTCVEYGLKF